MATQAKAKRKIKTKHRRISEAQARARSARTSDELGGAAALFEPEAIYSPAKVGALLDQKSSTVAKWATEGRLDPDGVIWLQKGHRLHGWAIIEYLEGLRPAGR